jgi:hypothetical protein
VDSNGDYVLTDLRLLSIPDDYLMNVPRARDDKRKLYVFMTLMPPFQEKEWSPIGSTFATLNTPETVTKLEAAITRFFEAEQNEAKHLERVAKLEKGKRGKIQEVMDKLNKRLEDLTRQQVRAHEDAQAQIDAINAEYADLTQSAEVSE